MYVKIGSTNKAAPGCATNTNQGPNHCKGVGLMSVPKKSSREEITAELGKVREQYEDSRELRLAAVKYARSAGLTNQAIGDQLGLTEAAVRQMLKRSAKL